MVDIGDLSMMNTPEKDFSKENVCSLCGSVNIFEWKRAEKKILYKCKSCSFVFIPRSAYVNANLTAQYEKNQTSPVAYYEASTSVDEENFDRTLEKVEKYQSPSKILDIGSSVGTFLDRARKRGWHGYGIEPNPAAVAIARGKGLLVEQGYFDDRFCSEFNLRYPRVSLDVIHMGDVIEHVFDPLHMIKLAYNLLRPEGYLVVVTPNIDNYFAKKFQIKPQEHLVYFNRSSMRYLLEKCNFNVLTITQQSRLRNLSSIRIGTTKLDCISSLFAKIASVSWLGGILNRLACWFIKDELFVIAKKG